MGSVVQDIFGSKDQDKGGEILPRSTLSAEQQQLVQTLLPLLQGALGQGPAQPTGTEVTSLQSLEDLAAQMVGLAGGSDPTTATGRDALTGIINKGPTDFEDFFKTTVQDPALRGFQDDILPTLRKSFSTDFFGGERREAEGRATEDLLRSLTESRSDLAFKTKTQDTQNILSATGLLPSFSDASTKLPLLQGAGDILASLLGGAQQQRESLATQSQIPFNQALAFLGTPQMENIVFSPYTVQGRKGIAGDLIKDASKSAVMSFF
jgi:hypothetical protein